MFQNIMVCTDGSSHGDVACRYGFLLADAMKARLTGLHVLDIRMIEGPLMADISGAIGASGYYAGWPQFRKLMEANGDAVRGCFQDLATKAGIDAVLGVETGHPVHVILEREASTDLLILGKRGENERYGRDLIGAVADRVTRRATKSCLVTPAQFTPVQKIMAACDGSPISEKVVRTATALARALNASLTLLTVTEKMTPEVAGVVSATAERTCVDAGCTPKVMVVAGHASEAILEEIVLENSDLIVMGAHAHTRIRQWFVGCTTQRVLTDSGIPALLVR